MVMTDTLKAGGHPARLNAMPPLGADATAPIPVSLIGQSSTLRTRRGQTLGLTVEGSEGVYVVRSGALMLQVILPQGLRQVVALLFPGDVVRAAFAPPGVAQLVVVGAGEVLRLRWSVFAGLAEADPEVARYFADTTARQTARQAIHMAALGRFDTRQRVATYLLELALRNGVPAQAGGVAFEMPLGRTDMADYLGLNADTLSRTMSRLRASGLLIHRERHRAAVRDLEALAALSPAADAVMALCGRAPASGHVPA